MTTRRIYNVKVNHPTGYHDGTHQLTVNDNPSGKSCYVSGGEFGCSRDYAADDITAIRTFLSEHACTLISIKKVVQS